MSNGFFIISFAFIYLAAPLRAKTVNWSLEDRIQAIEKSVLNRIGPTLKDVGPKSKLSILIFKHEKLLEVWSEDTSKKLLSYPFTAFSGKLGPKNQQGDKQIPEGIYKLTALNPNSNFYLSIRVNYPNELDLKRAKKNGVKDAGNDIYIHGRNKTVGCVPIGDQGIEDIFYLVHKVGLKNMNVVISPAKPPLPALPSLGLNGKDSLDSEKYSKIDKALKKINYPALHRK